MIFKYCKTKSIGCLKNSNKCYIIEIFSYFKKGCGFIFYKNYLELNIIKTIKFIIFYLNINFSIYNIFINIKPFNYFILDKCIDLTLFFSIFFSFFKLNFNKNIFIFGVINFNNGNLLSISNIFYKLKKASKNFLKFLIIPKINLKFFLKIKLFIISFNYLYEVFLFLKRCLAQRESIVVTRRLSRVRFS